MSGIAYGLYVLSFLRLIPHFRNGALYSQGFGHLANDSLSRIVSLSLHFRHPNLLLVYEGLMGNISFWPGVLVGSLLLQMGFVLAIIFPITELAGRWSLLVVNLLVI